MSFNGTNSVNPALFCPQILGDPRAFTSYEPRCEENKSLQMGMSNYEYRRYLQRNAVSLIQEERREHIRKYNCGLCAYEFADPSGNDSFWAGYARTLGLKM
jgi:hypothetical protein